MISYPESWVLSVNCRHPDRSAAKWKDPEAFLEVFATGSLDSTRDDASRLHFILHDLAVFHHEGNALGRGDVGRRVTRNRDHVGQLALLQRPELRRHP